MKKRVKHGTRHAWVKGGCRCKRCHKARVEADRARRAKRWARAAAGEIRVPHGSPHAYRDYGCRCARCRKANTEENRRQRGSQPRKVWTIGEKRRVLRVYATEGRLAAAALVGVNPQTVTRWAREEGVEVYRPPEVHGTRGGYQRGCRCDACVEGMRAKTRSDRARRIARFRGGELNPPHGTENAYSNYDCRCEPCKAAHHEVMAAAWQRRRAAS